VFASSALLALSFLLVSGCEEAPPPTATSSELQVAKKERETIIRKEYGSGAFPTKEKKKK
jgi:hypothetical protein